MRQHALLIAPTAKTYGAGLLERARTAAEDATAGLAQLGAADKLTRAYRPQTNGKVERFNRTLADEWVYVRPYASNTERTEALETFLHQYNYHRCHTALEGQTPISRITAR